MKKYRKNVAAIILSPSYPYDCKIFLGKRIDMDIWQFPQGGIDDNESLKQALKRELKEEIGSNNISIIAEYPEWLSYEFPSEAIKKKYDFDGQTQKYFLVKINNLNEINLQTLEPEFVEFKFVDFKEIDKYINHFKKTIYKKVLQYFEKEGYLG
ncbi:RNA pyrophosphohydrolase [Campylobacter canadensis]|uniref:RNA pyrophosphohydrolase n=1 Tax=Campylobacter canadensis TaxID=449520 RepID=A0ABS7WSV5_9BACT|nr:RNA pyrophosphohydrolase [Campylobacter canadensis]MBZ7987858.1 RNA pyrophosphohydrolase [Campylobacter canadensis]MBZ7994404.1 RNA pyrophosphohydrolase [Campylobacter canadensis]MBZ7996100.1 RNA pyrophosphohydrolase [Campylobacter canadensis]MBZ7998870.1 RNA pyrophosphohydrolase [Campylobacter canadensis]MBZ7999736.1 RNA pyrophosphohydrolase [Campylobacter canadensis]